MEERASRPLYFQSSNLPIPFTFYVSRFMSCGFRLPIHHRVVILQVGLRVPPVVMELVLQRVFVEFNP